VYPGTDWPLATVVIRRLVEDHPRRRSKFALLFVDCAAVILLLALLHMQEQASLVGGQTAPCRETSGLWWCRCSIVFALDVWTGRGA